MIFCDTSAVAKLYLPEKESAAVRLRFEAEDQLFVSELVRVELMSVFHRQLREKKWSREKFLTADRQFSHDAMSGFWSWVPLESAVAHAAAQTFVSLPETVFLRAADCIHLVTALQEQFSEIYTYDTYQSAAAIALGLKPVAIS